MSETGPISALRNDMMPSTPSVPESMRRTMEALTGNDVDKARRLREVAKDFEATLLHIVMKEMADTVDESGFVDDSAGKQVKGMFWQFLSDTVAEQGGAGIADQLYKDFCRMARIDPDADSTGPTSQIEVLR